MTKVYFTRTVKYLGVVYTSQTAVEVDDGDVAGLKADGLISKDVEVKTVQDEPVKDEPVIDEPVIDEPVIDELLVEVALPEEAPKVDITEVIEQCKRGRNKKNEVV